MAQAQLTSDDNSRKGEIQIIALDENTNVRLTFAWVISTTFQFSKKKTMKPSSILGKEHVQ